MLDKYLNLFGHIRSKKAKHCLLYDSMRCQKPYDLYLIRYKLVFCQKSRRWCISLIIHPHVPNL